MCRPVPFVSEPGLCCSSAVSDLRSKSLKEKKQSPVGWGRWGGQHQHRNTLLGVAAEPNWVTGLCVSDDIWVACRAGHPQLVVSQPWGCVDLLLLPRDRFRLQFSAEELSGPGSLLCLDNISLSLDCFLACEYRSSWNTERSSPLAHCFFLPRSAVFWINIIPKTSSQVSKHITLKLRLNGLNLRLY